MQQEELSKGIFTISLDFELIWGTLDKPSWQRMRPICLVERQEAVGKLLELFHSHSLQATWCTVGHLFLDGCSRSGQATHEPIDRDPCSNELADPIFYGRKLVQQILACPTPQEIGCHTFSHVVFSKCSRRVAEMELQASREAAAALGLRLTSFAFPRNRVGYLDVLAQNGIEIFRGPDRRWHELAPHRRWYHRLGHLADIAFAVTPPTVVPEWNENGLWDIPGSMLYTPSHGYRQYIPVSLRVARARKGLHAAARHRRIFHLWFHPTDVVIRQDDMISGLDRILDTASALREKGVLEMLPLQAIPARTRLGAQQQGAVAEVCSQ